MGVEYYLPVQRVRRKYSDRVKMVDQLVLRGMLFIRTDERRRIALLNDVYGLRAYMTDGGTYHPVVVPDEQIRDFRFMLEHGGGEVRMMARCFAPGDKVKVVSGPLSGFVCRIIEIEKKRCIAVCLGVIGTATLEVSPESLAPADKEDR